MLGFPGGFLPEKGHLYRLAFLKLSQHFRQRLQFVFGQDGAGNQKCFGRFLIDDLFVAGQGGKRRKDLGPVRDGHPGMANAGILVFRAGFFDDVAVDPGGFCSERFHILSFFL